MLFFRSLFYFPSEEALIYKFRVFIYYMFHATLALMSNLPHRHLTFWLTLQSLFALTLLLLRIGYSGHLFYLFLAWNLVLSMVPYFFAVTLYLRYPRLTGAASVILLFFWLLFFPNALYMVTDVIHLRTRDITPLWADALLLLSFVWTGVLWGFLSLRLIHEKVVERFGTPYGWGIVVMSMTLGSIGVYLGRFLRWNSWDILQEPLGCIAYLLDPLYSPLFSGALWLFTLGYAIFFILAYLVWRGAKE